MLVYLFVSCLPCSRYSYVEPTLDIKQDTWLLCHIHAFEFFGGSTVCIVPDNLKTGVIKHPSQSVVVHGIFVFTKRKKETLRPLPRTSYEICKWIYNRKIQINCYVAYEKNYYSAPHFSVGKLVDLRITENTLEIYLANERIATHPLFPKYCKNRYSTHESDLPEGKNYSGWDSARIRRWAERIGISCSAVIERIFQSVKFDKQGFNAALAVLRLSHKYSNERLEKACLIALNSGKRIHSYRDIEPILKTNQDKFSGPSEESLNNSEADIGYVRGAQFYEEV